MSASELKSVSFATMVTLVTNDNSCAEPCSQDSCIVRAVVCYDDQLITSPQLSQHVTNCPLDPARLIMCRHQNCDRRWVISCSAGRSAVRAEEAFDRQNQNRHGCCAAHDPMKRRDFHLTAPSNFPALEDRRYPVGLQVMEHHTPVALVFTSWTRTKISRAFISTGQGVIGCIVVRRDRPTRALRRAIQPVRMSMKSVPVSVEHNGPPHQRKDRLAATCHAAVPQLKRAAIVRIPIVI